MSNIREALRQRLITETPTQSIVGDRVYAQGALPNLPVFPYIVFNKRSNEHERDLSGNAQAQAPQFEIGCFGRTAKDADALQDAVRRVLDNRRYETWPAPAGGVEILSCLVDDNDEAYEAPPDGSGQSAFLAVVDVSIWHVESATPTA